MRKQNSDFEARFISEEGSRLKNRDYFGYVELDEFACYVIADGITEITDIESARLAIETVILSFQEKPSLSKRSVKGLLKQANRALLGKESDRRLKASITVVVTDYQKLRYGYVGNTRLRMYRAGIPMVCRSNVRQLLHSVWIVIRSAIKISAKSVRNLHWSMLTLNAHSLSVLALSEIGKIHI